MKSYDKKFLCLGMRIYKNHSIVTNEQYKC